jgi:hypothetical protein
MATGIGFSVAYASWAVLMTKIPWRKTINALPSFQEFIRDLPLAEKVYRQGRFGGQGGLEYEYCVLCWTKSDCPYRIPCKAKHLICSDCLIRRYLAGKSQCPLCCVPLHRMQTEERGFYNTIIACLCIICVFHIIAVALNVYRGWRLIGPTDALYFAPHLIAMRFYFQSQDPHTFDEGFDVSRQRWTLGSWALGLVIWICYTGK